MYDVILRVTGISRGVQGSTGEYRGYSVKVLLLSHLGSHCRQVVVLASSWKPGPESLERMMSLGDPKIRLHSTICRSRGS